MANLTVNIPDSVVPRVREAFGKTDPLSGVRTSATVADVQAALQSYLKGYVLEYETAKQAMQTRTAIGQENWNQP